MVKVKIEDETKRERFIRLAESRTQKVLDALRILGNCANPHNYEYYKEDIDKIFKAINNTMERTREKFIIHLEREEEFKL